MTQSLNKEPKEMWRRRLGHHFIALVKRQFESKVKIIRSDNASEFLCLTNFKGIIHEASCVGTPQQNERVERNHMHILNVARALHFQSHLPVDFGVCVFLLLDI